MHVYTHADMSSHIYTRRMCIITSSSYIHTHVFIHTQVNMYIKEAETRYEIIINPVN